MKGQKRERYISKERRQPIKLESFLIQIFINHWHEMRIRAAHFFNVIKSRFVCHGVSDCGAV